MKNKNGFTLIELLAVIVVLAIVTVIATQSVLPLMKNASRDAFAIEATSVIKSAKDALSMYNLGKEKLDNNNKSCSNDEFICFSVEKLIDMGLYEGSKDVFSGKVLIDITNDEDVPKYTLYLQKGAEFSIVGGTAEDYTVEESIITRGGLNNNSYTVCSCE